MATYHGNNKKIMQLETLRNGFNYIELEDSQENTIGNPAFAQMQIRTSPFSFSLSSTVEIAVPANTTISRISLKDKSGSTVFYKDVYDTIGASPTIYSVTALGVELW